MLLILKRSWGRSSLDFETNAIHTIVERYYVASSRLYIRVMTIYNGEENGRKERQVAEKFKDFLSMQKKFKRRNQHIIKSIFIAWIIKISFFSPLRGIII